MQWNRVLPQSVNDTRRCEKTLIDKPGSGQGKVSFPELRKGNVGLVGTTLTGMVKGDGMAMMPVAI